MLSTFDGIAAAAGDGPREFGVLARETLDNVAVLHEANVPLGWPTGLGRLDRLLGGGLHTAGST